MFHKNIHFYEIVILNGDKFGLKQFRRYILNL